MLTLIHVSHFPFLFLKQPRSSPELSVVCAELGTCPHRREGLWCEVPLLLLRWPREGSGDSPPCLTDCTAEARPLASATKKHRQRSSSKPQLQTDSGYKGKATLTGLPQQEGLLESRRVGIRKDIPPQVGGSSTFASLSPECLRRNQATPESSENSARHARKLPLNTRSTSRTTNSHTRNSSATWSAENYLRRGKQTEFRDS